MTSMKITFLALAALFLVGDVQAGVDACRTGKALEKRPLRLTLAPTNGSAPIEVLLRYSGCFTTDIEPLLGTPVPPTAVRRYRADGVAWAMELMTEDGGDTTEFFIYYLKAGADEQYPIAYLKAAKTAAIATGKVDWGMEHFVNYHPPKFDFSANVVTQ